MRRTLFAITCTLSLVFSWASFSSFRSEEFGKAGYYADSLHGRKTASGEKYDKNDFTCAHKSLPFGTKIRVTRLDNKRSVIVRVNDRGPFAEGYVTDVSRKAAEELDLIKAGTARVKIEVVEKAETGTGKVLTPAEKAAAATAAATSAKTQLLRAQQKTDDARPATYSTTTTATPAKTLTAKGASDPAPSAEATKVAAAPRNSEMYKVEISNQEKKGFGVQINTLNDADNVLPIIGKLRRYWPGKVLVTVENDPTTDVSTYRTILGPFTERSAAEANQKLAEKRGYKKCFVVDLEEM